MKTVKGRYHRLNDNFNIFVVPSASIFFYQLSDFSVGFKVFTMLPLFLLWIRIRDKTLDPDFK